MKRRITLLLILMSFMLAPSSFAQKAQDFAAKFMSQSEHSSELKLVTISPAMLGEMMNKKDFIHEEKVRDIMSHLKSIRILSTTTNVEMHAEKAEQLAETNNNRYSLYSSERKGKNESKVWMRKRGGRIVELIVMSHIHNSELQVINITGNMDDDFIHELKKL